MTRLFHQALTDELLAARHQPSDESVLLDMLLGQAEHTGWQARYLREHVAEHAAAADRLDQLLEDPHYLLTVDPARLVPHLDAARSAPARATAAVYRQSAHHLAPLDRPARASQLELTAHQLGCRSLAARIASAAPDRPWQTRWSHGRRATGHQVLTGHTGAVNAVAVGALPDGTPVIVSGGGDGTVRVWRLADGTPVGEPLRGHTGWVDAVAVGALPDGTPVIVSGGGDGTVRVWRLADGTPVGEPLTRPRRRGDGGGGRGAAGRHPGHRQRRRRRHGAGVAAGRRHPGRGAAARPRRRGGRGGGRGAAGRHPGHRQRRRSTARCGCGGWPTAPRSGSRCAATTGAVNAVAVGALPDGTPVIVSGGDDGTVRVWRLADGTPVGEPLTGHTGAVTAVAVGALPDGTPVIVSGGARRHGAGVAAGRRHPGRGAAARPHRRGERGGGRGAAGRHPGHRQRRRRRHGAGVAAGRRHPGRGAADAATTGAVNAVAVGALPDGTPVIVSGGGDAHGAGVAAGRRHPGRGAAARPHRPGERGGGRGAAGRHPGHRQRRRRRHGAGVAAGRRHPGRGAADAATPAGDGGGGGGAAGRHPGHRQRRRR